MTETTKIHKISSAEIHSFRKLIHSLSAGCSFEGSADLAALFLHVYDLFFTKLLSAEDLDAFGFEGFEVAEGRKSAFS